VNVAFDLSRHAELPAAEHTADVMLVDRGTGRPLPLDYNGLTTIRRDRGQIAGIELALPAGTALPPKLDAHVIADVFPLGTRKLR
jgi:hypothetical protein